MKLWQCTGCGYVADLGPNSPAVVDCNQCDEDVMIREETEVIDTLENLRDLLFPVTAWTRRVFARNAKGIEVTMMSPAAACWCISGALSRICKDPGGNSDLYKTCHAELIRDIPNAPAYLTTWNDTATHEMVLGAIDRTIARLEC